MQFHALPNNENEVCVQFESDWLTVCHGEVSYKGGD